MGKHIDVPSLAGQRPRPRPRVRALAAASGLLLAAALTGCDTPAPRAEVDFSTTEPVAITEIQISGGSGDVVVRGDGAEDQVQINRTVRHRGEEPGATYEITGTTLMVDTNCGAGCSVSYQIQAPPGVAVRGSNGSGDIDLTDVAAINVWVGTGSITVQGSTADVSVQTGSGDITVDAVRGALTAKTGSGTVRASSLRGGPTDVQVGSGDATVALADPGDVRVRASSGDLEVTVPEAKYRVLTSTGSGDEDVKLDHDPDGDHLVDVSSGSGDITIAAA